MGRDFLKKCSTGGQNGHKSRKCNGKGCIKLFGVNINADLGNTQDEAIRKCKSMENLPSCNHECHDVDVGYVSDGLIYKSSKAHTANSRKKGKPWSEEEHRAFLIGLEKLGKGDWKGISKNFLPSRNPTQVASHAQKYFLRASSAEKKRRRSSLFDMPLDALCSTQVQPPPDPTQQKTSDSQQGNMTSLIKTAEKPPLSPSARSGPEWRMPYMGFWPSNQPDDTIIRLIRWPTPPKRRSNIRLNKALIKQYKVGVYNNVQGRASIPTNFPIPKVSYGLVWGFPFAPYVPRPSSSTLPQISPNFGPCQADATIKDNLDVSILALKL